MICHLVSTQPVAITYLDDQKGDEAIIYEKDNEVVTYQREKEEEVITFQNNNLEDEETKYVVSS